MKRAIRILALLVGALIFASVAGAIGSLISHHPGKSNVEISYADFVVIMLTAVTLLVTLLAVILALVALIGWTTIYEKVGTDVKAFLKDGFRDGNQLRDMLIAEMRTAKAEVMFEGVPQFDAEFEAEAEAQAEGE